MDTRADGEPVAARPQRPRSSVPSFLFITFMLFMLTSHNGDEFLARHQYQDALQSLEYQLSNYTAWERGDPSNFTAPEREPIISSLLDTFHVKDHSLNPMEDSYYSNVTGFVHGNTDFFNITPPALALNSSLSWRHLAESYMANVNLTDALERIGDWNWTASNKVALSVVEKKPLDAINYTVPTNVALVHGRIELRDSNTADEFRLDFEGIHFLSNGSIFGFAEPPGRHIDIRLLPSIVPEGMRNETSKVVAPELEFRINRLKNLIDAGIIDQEGAGNDESPRSTCPFTFFAQMHPTGVPEHLMNDLENEIQEPTGIWTVDPPKLSMTGILLSKECGLLLEIKDTEGLRSRTFFRKVTTYAGVSGLVYLTLLLLFSRQMERSRTPSGVLRVSRWTFLAQSTIDSVSFAGHITFAILAEGRPSLSLIVPAFLACILFIQEAQFAGLIHQIQAPEDAVPAPEQPPANPQPISVVPPSSDPSSATPTATPSTPPIYPPAPPPIGPTATPTTTPTPTSTTTSPSFFSFFIHHVRTDPQARLWVMLFIFLTLIVRVILSPTLSMIFVAVTYSSIWLPQIARSARRGRNSGLSKEYILGTSVCRLYCALYFLACPKNVLEIEPRSWSYLLAVFVSFQALVLILQEFLGPSFFLPQKYVAVKTYDYHPPMTSPDPESPDQSLGDCAICMDAITVDSSQRRSKSIDDKDGWDTRSGGSTTPRLKNRGAESLLHAMQMGVNTTNARKHYSLAPCHHLFHTECLEKWLAIKNICPQCRRPLPPL